MEFDETKKCKRVKFNIGPIRIDLNPLVTIASAIIIWGFVIWCIIQPKSANQEFLKRARFVLFLLFRISFGGRLILFLDCFSFHFRQSLRRIQ